jgi:hypothetical protein
MTTFYGPPDGVAFVLPDGPSAKDASAAQQKMRRASKLAALVAPLPPPLIKADAAAQRPRRQPPRTPKAASRPSEDTSGAERLPIIAATCEMPVLKRDEQEDEPIELPERPMTAYDELVRACARGLGATAGRSLGAAFRLARPAYDQPHSHRPLK